MMTPEVVRNSSIVEGRSGRYIIQGSPTMIAGVISIGVCEISVKLRDIFFTVTVIRTTVVDEIELVTEVPLV